MFESKDTMGGASSPTAGYLTGQLLVAMPTMADPRFHRAVIYVCAHSAEGAMGLIVNKPLVNASEKKMSQATAIVERIEAHKQSQEYYSITANMKGESPEEVARLVLEQSHISGLRGPTISRVYTKDGSGTYAVTVIVEKNKLLQAVEQFRKIGGSSVTVSQPHYVFHSECKAARRLR